MWKAILKPLPDYEGKILQIEDGERNFISFESFLTLLQQETFARFFNQILANVRYKGILWECRPHTESNQHEPFECVILDHPGLARIKEGVAKAFYGYFKDETAVVSFPNLGKNALLVVPCPVAGNEVYGHLATFCRLAPEKQITDFWAAVGKNTQTSLSDQPLWLSTHGLGVYWLHVRLDTRPKYYRYRAYKNFAV